MDSQPLLQGMSSDFLEPSMGDKIGLVSWDSKEAEIENQAKGVNFTPGGRLTPGITFISVLLCHGCHNKVSQTVRLESRVKVSAGLISSKALLFGLETATFSLSSHGPLSGRCPSSACFCALILQGHSHVGLSPP